MTDDKRPVVIPGHRLVGQAVECLHKYSRVPICRGTVDEVLKHDKHGLVVTLRGMAHTMWEVQNVREIGSTEEKP